MDASEPADAVFATGDPYRNAGRSDR